MLSFGELVRPAEAQDSQRIAAVVNDEVISLHDLSSRIELLIATSNMPGLPNEREQIAGHVLRLLIEEKLKLQEARRLNVSVTPEEMDAALEQVAGQLGVPAMQISDLLRSRGVSPQTLIEQIQAELSWIKAVQQRAAGSVVITDEEVEARLDRLEQDAGRPEYRIAEIFLPVDSPSQEARVSALAGQLIAQLREGARFRSLARNFSQGPAAAVGGDLGWIRLEQLDPELRPVVERLTPGQAFGPVRTQVGIHIVYMIDRRVIEAPQRGAVNVSLSQLVLPLSPQPSEDEVREQMERAREIAEPAASCSELIAAADEADADLSGDLGVIELSQLDQPLRGLVRPLHVGGKTEPFRASYGVAVLMLCDREESDVNDRLRDQIGKAILNEKLAVTARRILRDLYRESFVDVRI